MSDTASDSKNSNKGLYSYCSATSASTAQIFISKSDFNWFSFPLTFVNETVALPELLAVNGIANSSLWLELMGFASSKVLT